MASWLGPNLDKPEPKRDIGSKFLLAVQGFYWLGPSDGQKACPEHVTLTLLRLRNHNAQWYNPDEQVDRQEEDKYVWSQ